MATRLLTLVWFLLLVGLLPAGAQDAAERERRMNEQRLRVLRHEREEAERRNGEAWWREEAKQAEARRQADLSRRREEQTKTPPAIAAAITSITTKLTSPPPALIVGTNTKYAILDRGRNAGVSRSDVVRCFARGAEIVRDGEQLGFDETPVGSGGVREV